MVASSHIKSGFRSKCVPWILGLLILLVVLWFHAQRYFPFIADDSLISLRYAERFLNGEGLTWTAGEAVEGYSNLSWTLGSALLGALGIDLITSVRVLGACSVALGLWALMSLSRALQAGRESEDKEEIALTAWFAGGALLVGAPPVGVWVIGGLEATLQAGALLAYLAGGVHLLKRRSEVTTSAGAAPFFGGLLCLTRPDGPLFIALWAAVFLAVQLLPSRDEEGPQNQLWSRLRPALSMVYIPAGMYLAQIAFRLVYYGDWVPNTAHIKAEPSAQTLEWGFDYWTGALKALWPLALPALLSLRSKRRALTFVCWLSIAAWVGYITVVGGDIFPGQRHALVVCALFAILTTIGVSSLTQRFARVSALVITLGLSVTSFSLSAPMQPYRFAQLERWEWDGQVIGEWLGEVLREKDPLLAVTAAGTLPYFSKLRALDMQGLNDRHIALQPGQRGYMLAHDHGDGAYVLSKRPDLLAFRGVGRGDPAFVSGDQMKRIPEFSIRYRSRELHGQWPYWVRSNMYFRLDGVAGVETLSSEEIVIPAYLLDGGIGIPMASPSISGSLKEGDLTRPSQGQAPAQIGASLPYQQLIRLLNFPIQGGVWAVETDPPLPIKIRPFKSKNSASGNLGFFIRYQADNVDAPLPRSYHPRHQVFVRSLRLTRVGESDLAEFTVLPATVEAARFFEQSSQAVSSRVLDQFEAGSGGADRGEWGKLWRQSGLAFATPRSGQAEGQMTITGLQGSQLLNSYHPRQGDRATGRAWGPVFKTTERSVLSFKLGGGSVERGVGLRLWINGIAVSTWGGENTEHLEPFHIDLRAYPNCLAQVEIFDHGQGAWGHLLVDDLRLSEGMPTALAQQ